MILLARSLAKNYSSKPPCIAANYKSLYSFSSSNQQPSNDPGNDQKQQNAQKGQQQNKKFTSIDQNQGKKIRAQAQLRVKRTQLAKFVKAQLDYTRLNTFQKQIEEMTKVLNLRDIKIKFHSQNGTRIQFYRTPIKIYRPEPRAQPRQSQKSQAQSSKSSKPSEQFSSDSRVSSQQANYVEEQMQLKIFVQSSKQLTGQQNTFFYNSFLYQQTLKEMFEKMNSLGGDNLSKKKKGFDRFQIKKMYGEYKEIIGRISEEMGSDGKNGDGVESGFKEFSVYLRNGRSLGDDKWLKVELIVQRWRMIHLHRLSIIGDLKQQISGNGYPSVYKGVQAHSLDSQLLTSTQQLLQQIQEISPRLFAAIYYYTGLQQHKFYRKWLEDLVQICK